jgi:hypothetical protein
MFTSFCSNFSAISSFCFKDPESGGSDGLGEADVEWGQLSIVDNMVGSATGVHSPNSYSNRAKPQNFVL